MELNDFIKNFAGQFDETPVELFSSKTIFKELEEWNSLTALSIIEMIDEEYEKTITGANLRSSSTIEELYSLVLSK